MLWAVLLGAAVELWSVVMSMGTKLNCGDLVANLILIVLLFFLNHRLSKLCATENCTYFAFSFVGSIILKMILDLIFS